MGLFFCPVMFKQFDKISSHHTSCLHVDFFAIDGLMPIANGHPAWGLGDVLVDGKHECSEIFFVVGKGCTPHHPVTFGISAPAV